MSTSTNGYPGGKLADYLRIQKKAFLSDLKGGQANGWVLAMGNEAGDLDSLSSSIAFSVLSSLLPPKPFPKSIPLILTPPSLLYLRPENLLALEKSKIPTDALLYASELPCATEELAGKGVKFGLVDHNSLLPGFRPKPSALGTGEGKAEDPVVAIIDHHEDEGQHSSASPRVIRFPTGSCSSLITTYFLSSWSASLSTGDTPPIPGELATLLMSSILIDTGGLKSGEKAKTKDSDRVAAGFLWGVSGLSKEGTKGLLTSASLEDGNVPNELTVYTEELFDAKMNVDALNSHDLLLRDYKEYTMATSRTSGSSEGKTLRVGLSTVPKGLKAWLKMEQDGWKGLMTDMDKWMEERDLDVEGVLTTFKKENETTGKSQSRREIVLVVRHRESGGLSESETHQIFETLAKGLQADPVLALQEWSPKKNKGEINVLENGKEGRLGGVWRQGNAGATRKQVAPLFKDIIGKMDL